MARPKNQSTTDIVRMLNLLPYFQQHPGRSTMEAAVDLGLDPATTPLACILEGGTWAAGREAAAQRRQGLPPLTIISDGTVF